MLHRVPHLSLEVITEKGVEIKGDDLSLNLPEFGVIDTPSQVPAVLHHGRNGPSDDLPRVRRSLQPSLDHGPGRLDFLPNGWGTAQDTKKNLDMLTDDLLKGIRNVSGLSHRLLGRRPSDSNHCHTCLLFGSPMTSDPYLFGGLVGDFGDAVAIGSAGISPPNGPPKPPKNRTPVKEVGKATGPVHSGTGGVSRDAVLDAKREALAKAANQPATVVPAHFVLQDDDQDTGQPPPDVPLEEPVGVMD